MKSKINIKISLILFVFILISQITAFGVGSAYHKDNPLKISAGETKEIIFNFQNPSGADITTRPAISVGSEILQFKDSNDFLVSVGSSVDFIAIVTIPNDALLGTTYPIELTFTTVETTVQGQTLGFGSSVGRKFDVIIVPSAEDIAKIKAEADAEKKRSKIIGKLPLIGIVILILIIVILVLVKKKKENKNVKKKI